MKTFIINDKITIEAEYYETRYSWGHKAYLYINGHEVTSDKHVYYNRTWESYQFQSVLFGIIGKAAKHKLITPEEKTLADVAIRDETFIGKKKEAEETKSMFKSIAMVAALGNVMTNNQLEANDWKKRMIQAGLGNKGLVIPDDWDTLSEDDKQSRLDAIIKELSK